MRKLLGTSFLVFFCLTISAAAQKANPKASSENGPEGALPVTRVILYKNGVGYFEHSAKIDGSQELHIDFTTDQLNDVLASLTATDLGNGRITSVRFNSIAPLSERLRALHLPLGADTNRQQFLEALRGTRVEVKSGSAAVTGKVLSVEIVQRAIGTGPKTEEVLVLSVITDNGELRTFDLTPGVSVRMANRELSGDVAQYLDLIGSERASDVRRMSISDQGTGERTVFISYISEVPVWKSTYRILLPTRPDEKPLLQGWAVVDNTLGEDWKDVALSLVSGAPQSFIEDLSTPYYLRRPVVPLPHSVLLNPQTHEGALEPMNAPKGIAGGVPGGSIGRLQAGTTLGGPVRLQAKEADMFKAVPPPAPVPEAFARQTVEATGKGVGELFEYDIKNKVTIGRNQSALVPILQDRLDAEKVTLWNASDSVPLRALWLDNTTGQTFDSGTLDVLDEGTFAGEGILDTIRAGEKRLISYAADPAVKVTSKEGSSAETVTRVVIAKGLMKTTREDRSTETYRISNSDSKPRVVLIEHPVREGWKLEGGLKPDETTADYYRFKVEVKPKESEKLAVEEERPEVSQIELTDLTSQMVGLLARQKSLTPQMEALFQKILEQKDALAALDTEIQSRRQAIENISRDQARIRENMKALKGGPEEKQLLERYVRELNAQEDRLAELRGQISGLKVKRDQASAQLDQTIEGISLDQTF